MQKYSSAGRVVCLSADSATSGQQEQRWEKVLWKQQSFPDNYTDSSFLRSLEVNAQVTDRDYWKLVLGSSAITQQIGLVALAVSVSVYLYTASDPEVFAAQTCPIMHHALAILSSDRFLFLVCPDGFDWRLCQSLFTVR